MADHSALDAHIARIRQLGHLARDSAPDVAKAVEREVGEQINRGTDPNGKPWKLTKEGKVPLRGAAKSVESKAVGTVVLVSVEGHHALHDRGWVRGGVRRQILPRGDIPQTVERAIGHVVTAKFNATMKGGR